MKASTQRNKIMNNTSIGFSYLESFFGIGCLAD
jgi:hypothetical protein